MLHWIRCRQTTPSGAAVMTVTAFPRPANRPLRRSARQDQTAPVAPPSGALINAILSYADIEEEAGSGYVVLKVSARRARDKVIRDMLGREAARLADVAVVWNEDESEIFRILDAATPLWSQFAQPEEEPLFELTDEAIAYIAATTGADDLARTA
jgi:hypothetical protein